MKNHQHGKGSNTQQNDGSFAGTVTLLGRMRQCAELSRYYGYGTVARKHVMIVVLQKNM